MLNWETLPKIFFGLLKFGIEFYFFLKIHVFDVCPEILDDYAYVYAFY